MRISKNTKIKIAQTLSNPYILILQTIINICLLYFTNITYADYLKNHGIMALQRLAMDVFGITGIVFIISLILKFLIIKKSKSLYD